MQLETLFKRTSTGAIQTWKIETSGDTIIKTTGQIGTAKPIIHNEVVEGKNIGKSNETTPEQQADSQAQSDWKRKKDSGYKTWPDLGIFATGFSTTDNTPLRFGIVGGDPKKDSDYTLEEALEKVLPQFNTDAAGQLLPQLAKSKLWVYGDKKNKYPQQAEIKFDGNRTTFVMTTDDTFALTRTGKPHANLGHLIDELNKAFPIADRKGTAILDGEVYLHGLLLEEINEAIKKPNEDTPKLMFITYDLPLIDAPQKERTQSVEVITRVIGSEFFAYSISRIVNSDDEVMAFHDEAVAAGYEGIMVKELEDPYQPGQRSSSWKKVKAMEDNEFEIVGHTLGIRGVRDLNFICKLTTGEEFEVTMNGTLETKIKLYDKIDTLVGKMLTVKHKGYTKYGIPNFAKGKAIREPGT